MRTLILGMGNDLLSDDAVGLKVVRRLGREVKSPEVEIRETAVASIELLDHLVGFDRVIIVDAIKTGRGKPGDVLLLDLADLGRTMTTPTSLHHVGLPRVLAMGKGLGLKMPDQVLAFAIEAKDVGTFGGPCCREVRAAIPKVAELIRGELGLAPHRRSARRPGGSQT